MAYAKNTSVSIERSQEEIKKTLRRYGCERFGVMEERNLAYVAFTINNLNIQIKIELPNQGNEEFQFTPTGKERAENSAFQAWDQAVRSRWRSLLLAIKAKLEAVECGISSIETEFLPFIVLGNGMTVGQQILPVLQSQAAENRPLALGPGND